MRTFLVLSPDIESIYFDNFAVFPRAMQQRLVHARDARANRRVSILTSSVRTAVRKNTDAQSLLDRLALRRHQDLSA